MDLQIFSGKSDLRIMELEAQRDLSVKILDTVNQSDEKIDIIKKILLLIKKYVDFDAVAIRSVKGNDFPYYVTDGFSEDFIGAENYLRVRDQNGEPRKGAEGSPDFECMCGKVLCGQVNSELPFFTEGGSFWTNSTSELLASTKERDRQLFTRNRCNREGYESVALIPLRASDDIIGLLQLNSHQKNKFTEDKINYFEKIGSSIGAGLRRKHAVVTTYKHNGKLEQKVKEQTYELSNSKIFTEQKIQERRQIEGSIRESERLYRSLISKMGNGFTLNEIRLDKNRKPNNSRFLEVNPAFEEITGLDKNDIVGKTVGDVFPGTETFWIDKCGQIALSGNSVQFNNCSKLFNRHFEIIAYSPVRGKVATVFTDITERIEIEAALRESENNFRAIAENANDGILIAEGEGYYVYANSRAREITEYSIGELKNMSYKDLVHPDCGNPGTSMLRDGCR
jgi:PAS domain S-box-containing protein